MEAAGIPTVSIINLRERMERLKLPRAVLVKFPRGANVGAPRNATQQRQVLTDALRRLEQAQEPAQIVELPYRWQPQG